MHTATSIAGAAIVAVWIWLIDLPDTAIGFLTAPPAVEESLDDERR